MARSAAIRSVPSRRSAHTAPSVAHVRPGTMLRRWAARRAAALPCAAQYAISAVAVYARDISASAKICARAPISIVREIARGGTRIPSASSAALRGRGR
eukprot:IDg19378t1